MIMATKRMTAKLTVAAYTLRKRERQTLKSECPAKQNLLLWQFVRHLLSGTRRLSQDDVSELALAFPMAWKAGGAFVRPLNRG
jgi:hypothetical protein